MKPKTLVLMLVAVSCGLVASFMTSRYLAAQQQPTQQEEKLPVLFAKKTMQGYTRLNDVELFEVRMCDKSSISKDAVGDFDRVKGRVLKNPLGEGKPLAESDLIDASQAALHSKLGPGEIAMAVKVSPESAGGGYVMPGDRVDVQATVTRAGNNEKPFSKFILQNIEVLAVGQDVEKPDGTVYKEATRVVLRLKHKQAEELAIYQDTGSLRLVLRRPDDTQVYDTPGARPTPGRTLGAEEANGGPEAGTVASQPITAPTVPMTQAEVPGPEVPKKKKPTLTVIGAAGAKVYEYKEIEDDTPKAAGDKK